MSLDTGILAPGSLVLVTGASGYVASHIVDRLLADGHNVRGTVRSAEKADWLYGLFDKKYAKGRFEAVVVPDMSADGAFDDAVKAVDAICHTATVMTFSNKPEEVVPVVVNAFRVCDRLRTYANIHQVKGATNIITAALRESGIKSLVYTSSSVAALLPQPNKVIKVTKDTWDDDAVNAAKGQNPTQWDVSDIGMLLISAM